MKRFLILFFLLASIFLIATAFWYLSKQHVKADVHSPTNTVAIQRLAKHANQAKSYARKMGFNEDLCMLIDMSFESGKNRFFVYKMRKDSVIDNGLVTHGRCNEVWLKGRRYGNTIGCGCTSVGKYKIGHSYKGRFGLAYKLMGLDSTNSNAYSRFVVLHSHECVPEKEVDPLPICQSDGCPTVSKQFLKRLSVLIDHSPKPILLWIYD